MRKVVVDDRRLSRAYIVVALAGVVGGCNGTAESGSPSSAGGAGNAGASGATAGGASSRDAASTGGFGGSEPDASQGPADLGKACSMTATPGTCSAGLSCMQAESIGGYVCTQSCSTNADCPSNGFCHAAGDAGGGVCARVCTHQVVCVALGTSTSCAARPSVASVMICAR